MGGLSPEERPIMGQLANELRVSIESSLKEKTDKIKKEEQSKKLLTETIDVTLPGKQVNIGKKHPLNLVMDEIKEIFLGMGFSVAEGPEIED